MAAGLVSAYLSRYPDVGLLQFFFALFRQAGIFQPADNVVKLRLEALQLCAKHLDLHFHAENHTAHMAMSSFLLSPRIPCFRPIFLKAAIAESR
jgi:hypothetical protein